MSDAGPSRILRVETSRYILKRYSETAKLSVLLLAILR